MSIYSELEKAREEQRLNVPAKRILEKIEGIPSDIEKLQRRWFWELLQNASDYNDEVEVVLEFHKKKIVFKHNGKPFSPNDAENLIAPDSGKDEEDDSKKDTIGQFGTGFISTHVLSARIELTGVMKFEESNQHCSFRICLDRTGFTDKEKLKKSIIESSKGLSDSLESIDFMPGNFDTTFTYFLEDTLPGIRSGQAVEPGVTYIMDMLPYTLAFMPKVISVTLVNIDVGYIDYSTRKFLQKRNGSNFLVDIETCRVPSAKVESMERQFSIETFREASVIVELNQGRVQAYPKNLTKLFCSLPMIGTEDFASPIAINSNQFSPKTERNGIRLTNNSHQNRRVMSHAQIAYKKLVDRLVQSEVDGLFNVCKLTNFIGDYAEKTWFKQEFILPIKNHLLESAVVSTKDGYVKLSLAQIPYFTLEDVKKGQLDFFYNLCKEFNPSIVPVADDFRSWFDNLDFAIFPNCKYELKDLAKEIDELGTIKGLEQRVPDAKKWLKDFIVLIQVMDPSLLDRYKIIPNQLGDLLRRKDNLNYDRRLDRSLIEVYNVLTGKNYCEILLDPFFDGVPEILNASEIKVEADLAKDVDDAFSSYPEDERLVSSFQEGLQLIFRWFSASGKQKSELNDLFKWFVSKKSQLFLETFNDENRDKVLSIAKSGKLESLSYLAESNFSNAEVKSIAENLDDLSALSKVFDEVPNGREKLLEYASDLRDDEIQFQFKKEIGEKVEEIFLEALCNSKIVARIIHQGWGSHDFEIVNQSNGKSYFIELKSHAAESSDPFRLAVSQAKKAIEHSDFFSLVTIERPLGSEYLTLDYIRKNTQSNAQIIELVSAALDEYDQLQRIARNRLLHITFRDAIRINIDKNQIIKNSTDFEGLIQKISSAIC